VQEINLTVSQKLMRALVSDPCGIVPQLILIELLFLMWLVFMQRGF